MMPVKNFRGEEKAIKRIKRPVWVMDAQNSKKAWLLNKMVVGQTQILIIKPQHIARENALIDQSATIPDRQRKRERGRERFSSAVWTDRHVA